MSRNPRGLALRRALLCAPAILFLVALPAEVIAQTAWKASGTVNSGNWTDASHWTAGVPGPLSAVTVALEPGAPYTVNYFANANFDSFVLNSSAVTFQHNGGNFIAVGEIKVTKGTVNLTSGGWFCNTLRFDGTSAINLSSAMRGDALIENTGTVNIVSSFGSLRSGNGTIVNSGTFNATIGSLSFIDFNIFTNSSAITGGPTAPLTFQGFSASTSTLTNSGTITAENVLSFNTLKTVTNNGTIAMGTDSTFGFGTLINSGTLAIGNSRTFSVNAATLENKAGGSIQGRTGTQGHLALYESTLIVGDEFNPNLSKWTLDRSKIIAGATGSGSATNNSDLTMQSTDSNKPSRVSVPLTNNHNIYILRPYNIFEKEVVNDGNIYVTTGPSLGSVALTAQLGLTNSGLFELSGHPSGGTATFTIGGTSSFVNESGGTFLIAGTGGSFSGDLDNQGTMTVDRPLALLKNSAKYTNSGQINIAATSGPVFFSSIREFENSNQITAAAGSGIGFTGSNGTTSTFKNSSSGTITANGGITFSNFKSVTNSGMIAIGNNSTSSTSAMTNSGTIAIGAGKTFLFTGNVLENQAGGVFQGGGSLSLTTSTLKVGDDFSPDLSSWTLDRSTVIGIEGTGTVDNQISLTMRSADATKLTRISVPLTNTGSITVEGNQNILDSSVENDGTISVVGNATLGSASLQALQGVTNRGLFRLTSESSSASAEVKVDGANGFVNESGATFIIAAGSPGERKFFGKLDNQGTITVASTLVVSDGSISNSGQVTISPGSGLTCLSITSLDNSNQITAGASSLIYLLGTGFSSEFNNSGTIIAGGGLDIGGFPQVNNEGTISISGGGLRVGGQNFVNKVGATLDIFGTPGTTHEIFASFFNRGTLLVRNGTLRVGYVGEHVGNQLTGGTWYVGNATLNVDAGANITTNLADVILDGASSSFPKIDSLIDNRGKFSILGGRNFTATALFSNSGELTVGAGSTLFAPGGFSLQPGGEILGGGTVLATVQNEGTASPGTSPGVLTINGGYLQQPAGKLKIELAGNSKGTHYDSLSVTGAATLGGILEVLLLDLGTGLFTPQPGDTFEILTSTAGVSGTFASKLLPALGGGRLWNDLAYGANNVVLSVGGVVGDYSLNGIVDGGDYVVWRKSLGQTGAGLFADGNGNGQIDPGDYEVWRFHFGQPPGSGSGAIANAAVPEPAALVLLTFSAAGISLRRRKRG